MKPEINEKNYYEIRAELVEKNANLVGIVLNEDEQRADSILSQLKKEYKDSCEGDVPYGMPVISDKNIWKSRLYSFCKSLPKGADLHVHGTSLLPIWKLIDFILDRKDILINIEDYCMYLPSDLEGRDSEFCKNCMPLREAFYNGYMSRKSLEEKWTIMGVGPDENAWKYFENLFSYQEALDRDFNILHDYYIYAFRDCIENNIFHVEIHILFSTDLDYTDEIVKTIRQAYYEIKKEYPEFCCALIGSSMKMEDYSVEDTYKIFENSTKVREKFKDESDSDNVCDFVLGVDLINEEDASRPLREYAPLLIEFKKNHPEFKVFLHCGESLEAQSNNLIDAYLISADRVGHGMNLYRYPDLLKRYADEEICLESCLISNQTLGYTKDIRLHPSAEYLKRGVTIALCSDDPVFQEHEHLTDDFFAAIVSWDLGIAEVKQLCMNSILYSGLNEDKKRSLLRFWHEAWKRFISEVISGE